MSVYIIAEMAWAHDGSLDKAMAIMQAAKKAGADAIGIHVTDLANYMVPYYGNGEGKVSAGREQLDIYKYLDDINPSQEDWLTFAAAARKAGIALCVMPNDINALKFTIEKIKPELYVIPAASFVEEEFLKLAASQKTKTLFRIGGAKLGEIESALTIFRNCGNSDVVLLHGIQMYPTKLEDTNLALLPSLKTMFGVEVGLADHIDGGIQLAKTIPLLAIPYGATYLEKHITLNRDEKGEDFESALNPDDFAEFVESIKAAELAIGNTSMAILSDEQLRYRNIVRKKIVARHAIAKGTILTEGDLTFKRCDVGITPDKLLELVGRAVTADMIPNEVITPDKLSGDAI